MYPKWAALGFFLIAIMSCQTDNKNAPKDEYNPSIEEILNEYPAGDPQEEPQNDENSTTIEVEPSVSLESHEKVDPYNLDFNLLIGLIEEGINLKRLEEGRMILRRNDVLGNAAIHQNNYQVQIGQLSHSQHDPQMRDVRERVNQYGGQFRTVGENVQFQGFQVVIRNGRRSLVQPAYQKTADDIVHNWINSPGHYRNLINAEFVQVGTAVAWSDERNALFATQVFGG